MAPLDNDQIVKHLRCGDPRGVEALLTQFGPLATTQLSKRFGLEEGDHALQDCLSDAALAMNQPEVADRLDANRNLGGYFYRTAFYSLNRAVKLRNGQPVPLETDHAEIADDANPDRVPTAFELAVSNFVREELTPREQELLRAEAEANCEETAEQVARRMPNGSTKEVVYQLRHRIKGKMERFRADWNKRNARSLATASQEGEQ